ncbi:MAG: hypothetical protein ACXWC5_22360 [Burkholderiales bacterium]
MRRPFDEFEHVAAMESVRNKEASHGVGSQAAGRAALTVAPVRRLPAKPRARAAPTLGFPPATPENVPSPGGVGGGGASTDSFPVVCLSPTGTDVPYEPPPTNTLGSGNAGSIGTDASGASQASIGFRESNWYFGSKAWPAPPAFNGGAWYALDPASDGNLSVIAEFSLNGVIILGEQGGDAKLFLGVSVFQRGNVNSNSAVVADIQDSRVNWAFSDEPWVVTLSTGVTQDPVAVRAWITAYASGDAFVDFYPDRVAGRAVTIGPVCTRLSPFYMY